MATYPTLPKLGSRVVKLTPTSTMLRAAAAGPAQPTSVTSKKSTATRPDAHGEVQQERVPLQDLIDQASAQLMIIRRTLDEATALGNAARRESDNIGTQLSKAVSTSAALDHQLVQVARATDILERTCETIKSLEGIVGKLREAQSALGQEAERRLAAQQIVLQAEIERMELESRRRLDRIEKEWAMRLENFAQHMDERLSQAQSKLTERIDAVNQSGQERVHAAIAAVEDQIKAAESRSFQMGQDLKAQADRMGANLDRQAAQTQARVSLAIDGAHERIADAERSAGLVAAKVQTRMDEMCDRAAQIFGVDVRAYRNGSDWRSQAVAGSVAEMVHQAEAMQVEIRRNTSQLNQVLESTNSAIAELMERAEQVEKRIEGAMSTAKDHVQSASGFSSTASTQGRKRRP